MWMIMGNTAKDGWVCCIWRQVWHEQLCVHANQYEHECLSVCVCVCVYVDCRVDGFRRGDDNGECSYM